MVLRLPGLQGPPCLGVRVAIPRVCLCAVLAESIFGMLALRFIDCMSYIVMLAHHYRGPWVYKLAGPVVRGALGHCSFTKIYQDDGASQHTREPLDLVHRLAVVAL